MKILMLLLAGLACVALARAETDPTVENFSQTYIVSAKAELSLSNINGSVEVVTWDKNEIAVDAEKRASDSDDLAKIQIEVDASANRVDIKTEHERTWWYFNRVNGSVRYTLHVPSSLAVCKIHVVNSDITISGVRSQIDASTVNGSIHVKGTTTQAHLHSVNGNIDASLEPDENDPIITAKTVNGSCHISLPATIATELHGSTVNGNIKCALPLANMESSRRSLSGRIGAGDKGKIEVSTVNGNISFNPL